MAHHLAELFSSTHWYPESVGAPQFGALAIIVGSLYVSVGALLIAVPVGLLAAMCLSDILPFTVKELVKPVIEILAAIPSVAFGFFAIIVVAPLMQQYLGIPTGTNALNCALLLAAMAIPTIVSVSEDSLTAVGRDLREASYACGATRAETLLRVVMPAAHSGILAAVVLGMMRAIGETMVVWMASGNAAQIPSPWWDLTQSVRTLTGTIAGEMGETVHDTPHYSSLFALGLLLLVFTFLLNLVTEHFLRRVRRAGGAGDETAAPSSRPPFHGEFRGFSPPHRPGAGGGAGADAVAGRGGGRLPRHRRIPQDATGPLQPRLRDGCGPGGGGRPRGPRPRVPDARGVLARPRHHAPSAGCR